jgi:5-methylcytosine-specific restriction endonuclease McrA
MTPPLRSPKEYLFNLYTTSSGEAKRLWRMHIKEQWNNECAYCGSQVNLTIDHIVPRSKGGPDFSKNCLCSCHKCNQDKSHTPVEQWYRSQEFFSEERFEKIKKWAEPEPTVKLYTYGSRRNILR